MLASGGSTVRRFVVKRRRAALPLRKPHRGALEHRAGSRASLAVVPSGLYGSIGTSTLPQTNPSKTSWRYRLHAGHATIAPARTIVVEKSHPARL
jgi:hypothetical protein